MNLKSKQLVKFGALAISIALLITTSSANAATLNVVGGQLLGASGVIVDGSSYNVEFLEGMCFVLYNGCDEASDLPFQTRAAAELASQALLDQVFLDGANLFDTDTELTNGCLSPTECFALTPWNLAGGVRSAPALNTPSIDSVPFSLILTRGNNSADFPMYVYAVWSPVPEPGTAVLMGLGLLGLAARTKSQP